MAALPLGKNHTILGNVGQEPVRNGAPGLKDASAWSSGATASLDAATRATLG
jgi:hypothetical protein